jgi:hypothetical protein
MPTSGHKNSDVYIKLNRGQIYRMALEICRNSHTFMYSLPTILPCSGRYSGPYGISLRDSTKMFLLLPCNKKARNITLQPDELVIIFAINLFDTLIPANL